MDVFELRDRVIRGYGDYVRSFLTIRDDRIRKRVTREMTAGLLWPNPLVQLNPAFEPGESISELVASGTLHTECTRIFRSKPENKPPGPPFRLYRHQVESVRAARDGDSYVLTTGTGSGKSLAYIVPIVDHVLRHGSGKGIQAVVVYPMNALANSQVGELEKFLCRGYPQGRPPVTFRRYTGQESDAEKQSVIAHPPDILLTNYVMLELILTRPWERRLVRHMQGLRFLVLDELHTYRGRQGADVAMLVRRLREMAKSPELIHVGTSATLAGGGTWKEQQSEVAEVASRLFGHPVSPERVIGETLRRHTPPLDPADTGIGDALRKSVLRSERPSTYEEFLADPLTSWIESTLGLTTGKDGRLARSTPRSITGDDGAAALLAEATGLGRERCERELREALLTGSRLEDEAGSRLFAFRLHQFISKGDAVYASPEAEAERHVTLQAQQFVPESGRSKALLPLAFCRECGQEYYTVRRNRSSSGEITYLPRTVSDRLDNEDGEAGFLYISTASPWPDEPHQAAERLPDAWLEVRRGALTVLKSRRPDLPQAVYLSPLGEEGKGEQIAWWLKAPFRLCLRCGVAYDARQKSDFGKLGTLGSEGRSTATTILSLTAIRQLRGNEELDERARKLLSFTDNRQDASLQAGHFNDFVEIALLRSALARAVAAAGEDGIRHDELTSRVMETLDLPFDAYAANPQALYAARDATEQALRGALGYFLYRDLQRGWRITSPNLEQCGLLRIEYGSLDLLCQDQEPWRGRHPILEGAGIADREKVCQALLDYLRRELVIRVDFLDPAQQDRLQERSRQRLVSPWTLHDLEKLERSRIVFPRARGDSKNQDTFVFLSPRGGFGLYLKRTGTFQQISERLSTEDVEQIIRDLCEVLVVGGQLHRVCEPRKKGDVGGYQVSAGNMVWHRGTGSGGFHDPIRVPQQPRDELRRTNPYFTTFYESDTSDLNRLEAREHTAQVTSEARERREERFRKADLPLLYCSPTMELGVDIAELNVVSLRNVPPTPANYAQRSGRAGRSGQPAFVFAYCSAGSPHDQYFFKRPEAMVAGAVTPPRLDLANEELLEAHVHAVWLGASGLDLKTSLPEILDLNLPGLPLRREVEDELRNPVARRSARGIALAALGSAVEHLVGPSGDAEGWIDRVLHQLPERFDRACRRWRDLYQAAYSQARIKQDEILDPSRDPRAVRPAARLRDEAEAQIRLLRNETERHSDFYSYRYFASEGFLPGYNFPRLPLSAYLPGRREGPDEFLTRPRFLAISEFGPRSIIYHEGSRYVINRVILPMESDGAATAEPPTRSALHCTRCGYLHPLADGPGPDLCEHCAEPLTGPARFDQLFRMTNVATRRRDRINSDEEERFRLGYELKTGVRFASRDGEVSARTAQLIGEDGEKLATFHYGRGATLWRMNLGWRRRQHRRRYGYLLDLERGYWERSEETIDDPDDPMSARTSRVIPYVEDTRNCLLVEPVRDLGAAAMATLQAALGNALQVEFQLEDRELAAEPLPDPDDRQRLLFYESAEGGAGVLGRLLEPDGDQVLARLIDRALEIAHFAAEDGADLGSAPGAGEPCEAACYDCLLSYYNQRDHRLLDRHLLPALLMVWRQARLAVSPAPGRREDHLRALENVCHSELEMRWLRVVGDTGLRLPSHAQVRIDAANVCPDFLYRDQGAAVFVDGPHHDRDERRAQDAEQQDRLEDLGLTVIRFHHDADWGEIFRRYPTVFGTVFGEPVSAAAGPTSKALSRAARTDRSSPAEPAFDPFAFDPLDYPAAWRPLMESLDALPEVEVEPGEEVMHHGRALDLDLAGVRKGGHGLRLVDADTPKAEEITAALTEQGHRVLALSRADPDADTLRRILERLEAAG